MEQRLLILVSLVSYLLMDYKRFQWCPKLNLSNLILFQGSIAVEIPVKLLQMYCKTDDCI